MTSRKRLVQLDVDSTFIQQEAIELLAAKAGVLAEVSRITEAAMRGELDFTASLKARVRLLEGLTVEVIAQVQEEIVLTDGAKQLVEDLHARGDMVALVSGGFIDIIEPIIKDLSIDFYKANKLEIHDGRLTGQVTGKIIDRKAKADALHEFAQLAVVSLDNCVAIGDGANDLDMMAIAGLSIAFNAKAIVAQAADVAISEPSLRSVISIIDNRLN